MDQQTTKLNFNNNHYHLSYICPNSIAKIRIVISNAAFAPVVWAGQFFDIVTVIIRIVYVVIVLYLFINVKTDVPIY